MRVNNLACAGSDQAEYRPLIFDKSLVAIQCQST